MTPQTNPQNNVFAIVLDLQYKVNQKAICKTVVLNLN